ncbi:aliphatic sulfonates import ATP-binding protein SsuB [Kitasatospora phosalacinea]|uniref:Aliphatic sulfonates import ATP-binding protein SsuB n=1 Tax=Kitasatospora phosalacinea TaxID=2065 RepID=A0A9W6Q9L4_9ACTN|nr:ABC transporter ATP-binding protein [Kitasatospora phosalacinea]GLW70986.1 aliphatic sulfonates import ATP-binding protein SsuB [Kitasatospora phosalacinea]
MAHHPGLTAPTDPVPGVRLRGLHRAFGGRTVLDDIELDIAKGEFTALLGHSGSGKSTLLRAVGGLDGAAAGRGVVEVPEPSAVVFQDARLLPWSRVLDNVVLGLPGPRAAALARGRAALAEVGLAGKERAWPGTLSGGEAQRAALARALVRSPELLLLDEPFGALDALTRIQMHSLLRNLCARHQPAVLLVTHDVDEALLLADRVLVLADGRFSLDLPLGGPAGPGRRGSAEFTELRERLLRALGVPEEDRS